MSNSSSFRHKTVSGLKWSLINQVVQFIFQFSSSIILARLLLPEDYGLFGMVNVISGFAMIFANFGLGSAIIQSKRISEAQLSSIFWLNVIIGGALTITFFVLAGPIATFYGDSRLVEVTRIIGLNFIVLSVGLVHSSLLSKKMDFKAIFFLNFLVVAISLILAIYLAINGFGVFALVVQSLLSYFLRSLLLFFAVKWKPKFTFSIKSISHQLKFSSFLFGTNSIRYWTRNADNLLIGKFLGPDTLGIYTKSYSIMMLPLSNIASVISRVIFPSFSMIQDDIEKIKSVYFKITKAIALISFPLMLGLCVTADVFIPVVFGQNWSEMIFIVQVLSLIAIPQSIGTLNGNLYLFCGKTKFQFKVTTIMHLIVVAFIAYGVTQGLKTLVICYGLGSLLIMYHNFKYPLSLINAKFIELVLNLLPIFIYATVMAIVVRLIHIGLSDQLEDAFLLLIDIISGITIYSVLLISFESNFLSYLLKLVRKNA
ncbi:MOP flippase family protein [Ekhidna sp.]|uniref:MOP flippase family protein n=1 Tax=Ekhidna sp. TaxID=2608089 RepID=UPI003CCBCE22